MSRPADDYFFHVEGPQGQRVIIVPPQIQITKQAQKYVWCLVSFIIGLCVSAILLLLGIVYGSVQISRHLNFDEGLDGLGIAAIVLLVIGGLFLALSMACWCHIVRLKSQRVRQYMHKDGSNREQTTEEQDQQDQQDREEYGFGIARGSPLPEVPSIDRHLSPGPRQSYPSTYGSQPFLGPRQSPRSRHQLLPTQRNDYHSSDPYLGRGSPSSYHSAQRVTQGNSSLYHHYNRQSPRHLDLPNLHGGLQYSGTTIPSRSSPVVDRSSPSSSSTYLSPGSRTSIPLDYNVQYRQ